MASAIDSTNPHESSKSNGEFMEMSKDNLLNELMEVRGDNVENMDVSSLLLKYFEEHKSYKRAHTFIGEAWTCNDQAARRLHLASLKGGPRLRFYPGSRDRLDPGAEVDLKVDSQLTSRSLRRNKTKEKLKKLKQTSKEEASRPSSRLSNADLQVVSEVLISSKSTAPDVHKEVTSQVEEAIKQQKPIDDEFRAQLERTVTNLIREIISVAEENLDKAHNDDDMNPPEEEQHQHGEYVETNENESERSMTERERIESFAANMVAGLTENVTRELQSNHSK